MDEDVLPATARLNETEALRGIEPFDSTSSQFKSPWVVTTTHQAQEALDATIRAEGDFSRRTPMGGPARDAKATIVPPIWDHAPNDARPASKEKRRTSARRP